MTRTKPVITQINIYRSAGEWCYAAFSADGFDHSDTIGCADGASEGEACAELTALWPDATITRVDDRVGAED